MDPFGKVEFSPETTAQLVLKAIARFPTCRPSLPGCRSSFVSPEDLPAFLLRSKSDRLSLGEGVSPVPNNGLGRLAPRGGAPQETVPAFVLAETSPIPMRSFKEAPAMLRLRDHVLLQELEGCRRI